MSSSLNSIMVDEDDNDSCSLHASVSLFLASGSAEITVTEENFLATVSLLASSFRILNLQYL